MKKRKRYRKLYPGETEGITEEMRFVAMRLRNVGGKYTHKVKRSSNSSGDSGSDSGSDDEVGNAVSGEEEGGGEDVEGGLPSDGGEGGETWIPNLEGFVKYLVDSKLVFDTVERIVDESSDVACECFFSPSHMAGPFI